MEQGGLIDLLGNSDESYADYGFKWCLSVKQLRKSQQSQLEKESLIQVYEKVELPLVEVLAAMEAEGFTVSKETLENFVKRCRLGKFCCQSLNRQQEKRANEATAPALMCLKKLEIYIPLWIWCWNIGLLPS